MTCRPVGQHVVETARAWAKLGRRSKDGGPIDRHVIQPFRPLLIEMGHLGRKDDVTFINWCGMWVHAVLKASGVEIPMRHGKSTLTLASCQGWSHMATVTKSLVPSGALPEPGDLVLFNWDADKAPEHIGILLDWRAAFSMAETAEGNASDREQIKMRYKSRIHSIISLDRLIAAVVKPVPKTR